MKHNVAHLSIWCMPDQKLKVHFPTQNTQSRRPVQKVDVSGAAVVMGAKAEQQRCIPGTDRSGKKVEMLVYMYSICVCGV